MSSVLTYELPLITKGDTVLFKVYSHCQSAFNVKLLKKQSNTVFEGSIRKINDGSARLVEAQTIEKVYDSDELLSLVITNEDGADLDGQMHNGVILSPDGEMAGSTYSVCVEDGCDADYNDIFITIASWRKGGK